MLQIVKPPTTSSCSVNGFNFSTISTSQVRKALLNLDCKKSAGPDQIDPYFLKTSADLIARPIASILNLCLCSGSQHHNCCNFCNMIFLLLWITKNYALQCLLIYVKHLILVDHGLILQSLQSIGFSDIVLNWFSNYLSGRTQRVPMNNCNSASLLVKTGVPQGSILSSLFI